MEFLNDFFDKIFAAFNTEDSIAFLTFIFASFLFGFIIAAIGYGSRARRARRELDQLKKNYEDLQIEHERLQEQIDLKQADLIRAEREAEEATMLVKNIEREKENQSVEIAALTEENKKLLQLTQTYSNNIEALNNQILGLKTRNNQLADSAEQEGEAMNQLMQMQSSYNATVNRLSALEAKLENFSNENSALRAELDTVKSTSVSGSFEDLENRINALSKENADLQKSLADMETNSPAIPMVDMESKINKILEDNAALHQELETVKNSSQTLPLTDLESKIEKILADNALLHQELEAVKSSAGSVTFPAVDLGDNRAVDDKEATKATVEPAQETSKAENTENARAAVKAAIGTKISTASREQKDDLTVIKGIGSFIEQKLNGLGIFTYKQISEFDKELVDLVTSGIEFFPGRIERDDWVGQATRLLDIKKNDPGILKKSIYPDNVEDLKIIEGIGPKLEKLLKDAGISTWDDLAKSDVKHLKEILIKGGDQYRIHDPSTWPLQAQMAADWKWTELKDYQDYLVGGKGVR